MSHEENLSTKQPPAQEDPRVSRADAHQGGPEGPECASAQGSEAALALTGFGLPRERRLRRRAEFRRVYEQGVRAAGRYVVVFATLRQPCVGPSRLGITATRRLGGAVVRTRCKRRVREIFRLGFTEAAEAMDVVVNPRRSCADAPWEQLRRDLLRCLERVRFRLGERSSSCGSTSGGSHRSCHRRADSSRPARSTRPKRSRGTGCTESGWRCVGF